MRILFPTNKTIPRFSGRIHIIYSFFSASAGSAFALLQYWKPATAIVSVIIKTNVKMNIQADMPVCSTKFSSHLMTA